MTYGEFMRRAVAAVALVITTVILLIAITRLSSILLLVFLCWVLSIGMNALIHRLQRLGLSRGIAAVSSFIGVIIIFLLILGLVIPPFVAQAVDLVQSLPDAVESLVDTYAETRRGISILERTLPEFTLEDYQRLVETELNDLLDTSGVLSGDTAININSIVSSALPLLGGIGSFVGNLLANTVFILLITAYLVADPMSYYRPLVALVPKDREQRVVDIINRIHQDVISWIGTLAISITFISTTVMFFMGVVLNIPNAIALGVLSGFGTIIPNVGYYIGLIPLLLFVASVDLAKVIPAGVIYWLLYQIEGNLITPNVMKEQLNIPPAVILPFQLIAAVVMGFYGILLAVPMLSIIITLGREIYVKDVLGKSDTANLKTDAAGQLYLQHQTPAESVEGQPATT